MSMDLIAFTGFPNANAERYSARTDCDSLSHLAYAVEGSSREAVLQADITLISIFR